MTRLIVPMVFVASLAIAPAHAAMAKTEKDKCFDLVKDVSELLKSDDSPGSGDKAEAEAAKLIEIATHLCDQGNFVYAGELLQIARTHLASE